MASDEEWHQMEQGKVVMGSVSIGTAYLKSPCRLIELGDRCFHLQLAAAGQQFSS
jgi:hypothetical protein